MNVGVQIKYTGSNLQTLNQFQHSGIQLPFIPFYLIINDITNLSNMFNFGNMRNKMNL